MNQLLTAVLKKSSFNGEENDVQNNMAGMCVNVVYEFDGDFWVVDSGVTNHFASDISFLENVRELAKVAKCPCQTDM